MSPCGAPGVGSRCRRRRSCSRPRSTPGSRTGWPRRSRPVSGWVRPSPGAGVSRWRGPHRGTGCRRLPGARAGDRGYLRLQRRLRQPERLPGGISRPVPDRRLDADAARPHRGRCVLAGRALVPRTVLAAGRALCLGGAVVSGLTIGKVGSNVNYLIELGAGVSLAIGALIAWQRPRRAVHAAIALLLAFDMALVVLASPYRTVTHVRLKQGEEAQHLLDVVHRTPGIALA